MNFKNKFDQDENLVIFYADDDEDDRDTFSDVIDELHQKSELHTHGNGDQLLNALKNPPPKPSLIFLDLNMPGKTGFEVLKEIRNSNDLKNLPVIVVSTSSDERSIVSSKELGANFYITKPTNYNDLKKSINHALTIDWVNFNPDNKNFVYRNN